MPSYQVNSEGPSYGRTSSGGYSSHGVGHSNYGYSQEMSEKNRYDRPPSYTSSNSRDDRRREGGSGHSRNKSLHATETYQEEEYERGHWGSKAEFLLSCIGYSVGIGNVWRFPYLAYQNGGGAFLVPYFILLLLVGKPMYYMETALGQYARLSPLQVWRCAPIATGVGVAMLVVSLIVAIYYNVIMAYSIIYVGVSFRGITDPEGMPWSYCGAWWGADDNCRTRSNITDDDAVKEAAKLIRCNPWNASHTEDDGKTWLIDCNKFQSSSEQFWEKYVLNISPAGLAGPARDLKGISGLGDLGGWSYELPLALAFSWIVVFLCLMKGVKSSGKVVYFTATFPYLVLIALLVRGVTLPGALDGLLLLFVPKWEKMLEINVWRDAASQMFFSLGVSWGGLVMFGSYNKFHNKINWDAAFVSSMDFFTSIISSCVVFSILGYLSRETGVPVDEVAKGGQGLAFIAYPEALATVPLPWLWSILFFLMLFFLGLDSEFALLETVLTAIYDGFPKARAHKVKLTFLGCLSCFLLGLPCVSSSGQYVLNLMDTYGAGFAVIWIALWEVICLMWIYGVCNFSKDISLMIGSQPFILTKVCWAFVCPVALLVIFILSLVYWSTPLYNQTVPYPDWAHWLGWVLVGISAVQVPLWAVLMSLVYLCKRKLTKVVRPTREWGPGDPQVRRAIYEEQHNIAPGRKHNYSSNYNTGYDNQAISAYNM